ncbi:hypothetical protein L1987_73051 [Smallanthus sonchifolius]|uniref:Uncharacterized protein n=1 Tax=Smallanthus sonchifolius TaxID=185202 RepID=A0ACB9AW07_9ASTR|nr:hypothetical protein L1987_73051 [Smallanthus sonchifolius]
MSTEVCSGENTHLSNIEAGIATRGSLVFTAGDNNLPNHMRIHDKEIHHHITYILVYAIGVQSTTNYGQESDNKWTGWVTVIMITLFFCRWLMELFKSGLCMRCEACMPLSSTGLGRGDRRKRPQVGKIFREKSEWIQRAKRIRNKSRNRNTTGTQNYSTWKIYYWNFSILTWETKKLQYQWWDSDIRHQSTRGKHLPSTRINGIEITKNGAAKEHNLRLTSKFKYHGAKNTSYCPNAFDRPLFCSYGYLGRGFWDSDPTSAPGNSTTLVDLAPPAETNEFGAQMSPPNGNTPVIDADMESPSQQPSPAEAQMVVNRHLHRLWNIYDLDEITKSPAVTEPVRPVIVVEPVRPMSTPTVTMQGNRLIGEDGLTIVNRRKKVGPIKVQGRKQKQVKVKVAAHQFNYSRPNAKHTPAGPKVKQTGMAPQVDQVTNMHGVIKPPTVESNATKNVVSGFNFTSAVQGDKRGKSQQQMSSKTSNQSPSTSLHPAGAAPRTANRHPQSAAAAMDMEPPHASSSNRFAALSAASELDDFDQSIGTGTNFSMMDIHASIKRTTLVEASPNLYPHEPMIEDGPIAAQAQPVGTDPAAEQCVIESVNLPGGSQTNGGGRTYGISESQRKTIADRLSVSNSICSEETVNWCPGEWDYFNDLCISLGLDPDYCIEDVESDTENGTAHFLSELLNSECQRKNRSKGLMPSWGPFWPIRVLLMAHMVISWGGMFCFLEQAQVGIFLRMPIAFHSAHFEGPERHPRPISTYERNIVNPKRQGMIPDKDGQQDDNKTSGGDVKTCGNILSSSIGVQADGDIGTVPSEKQKPGRTAQVHVIETRNSFQLLDAEGNIMTDDAMVNNTVNSGGNQSQEVNGNWQRKQERVLNTRFRNSLTQDQRFEAKRWILAASKDRIMSMGREEPVYEEDMEDVDSETDGTATMMKLDTVTPHQRMGLWILFLKG